MLGVADFTGVLELRTLLLEPLLDMIIVAVTMLAFFNTDNVMGVFLGKDFSILDWLNRSVVMVLVNLAVHYFGGILVVCAGNMLVGDSGVDCLMDGSVMLSVLGKET